jgi:hypothetical protein
VDRFVIAALSCILLWSSAACVDEGPRARDVHDCGANDALACDRVAGELERLFAGGSDGADRLLAHKLASAALQLIRPRPTTTAKATTAEQQLLDDSLRKCAGNEDHACGRIARVLSGLFAGADVQLDASPDRQLARAFAKRLLSISWPVR